MPVLKWRLAAANQLYEIVAHIAQDNPEAAMRLKQEIEEKARRLLERPRLYRQGRVPGTREMVIGKNYIAVYTETPEAVTILRILHAARDF